MQKSNMPFVFTLLLVYVFLVTTTVLAVPIIYQCEAPMQSLGSVGLRVPAPLPSSGELLIKFQRTAGESTQTSISFAEVKQVKTLLDRVAKAINDEAAQRGPKMAAVRERGADQTQSVNLGPINAIVLSEILRVLVVYDPAEMLVSFQATNNYTPLCFTLAPVREIPNLTEVKIESKPKLLFAAFPERVTSGQITQGATAFADADDDVALLKISYQSEDGTNSNTSNLDLATPLIPGLFGEGLKAVRFSLTVDCRRETKFLVTIVAKDKKNQESGPVTFDFICER